MECRKGVLILLALVFLLSLCSSASAQTCSAAAPCQAANRCCKAGTCLLASAANCGTGCDPAQGPCYGKLNWGQAIVPNPDTELDVVEVQQNSAGSTFVLVSLKCRSTSGSAGFSVNFYPATAYVSCSTQFTSWALLRLSNTGALQYYFIASSQQRYDELPLNLHLHPTEANRAFVTVNKISLATQSTGVYTVTGMPGVSETVRSIGASHDHIRLYNVDTSGDVSTVLSGYTGPDLTPLFTAYNPNINKIYIAGHWSTTRLVFQGATAFSVSARPAPGSPGFGCQDIWVAEVPATSDGSSAAIRVIWSLGQQAADGCSVRGKLALGGLTIQRGELQVCFSSTARAHGFNSGQVTVAVNPKIYPEDSNAEVVCASNVLPFATGGSTRLKPTAQGAYAIEGMDLSAEDFTVNAAGLFEYIGNRNTNPRQEIGTMKLSSPPASYPIIGSKPFMNATYTNYNPQANDVTLTGIDQMTATSLLYTGTYTTTLQSSPTTLPAKGDKDGVIFLWDSTVSSTPSPNLAIGIGQPGVSVSRVVANRTTNSAAVVADRKSVV